MYMISLKRFYNLYMVASDVADEAVATDSLQFLLEIDVAVV